MYRIYLLLPSLLAPFQQSYLVWQVKNGLEVTQKWLQNPMWLFTILGTLSELFIVSKLWSTYLDNGHFVLAFVGCENNMRIIIKGHGME